MAGPVLSINAPGPKLPTLGPMFANKLTTHHRKGKIMKTKVFALVSAAGASADFINTPLQRGDRGREGSTNHLNGFSDEWKTVETVRPPPSSPATPLKRGVNETCSASPSRMLGLLLLFITCVLCAPIAKGHD